jgi:hypothetical protein
MKHATCRRILTLSAVLAGLALLAPAAGASTSPALSLNQSAGKTAGSTRNLGLDLKFVNSGTDSPHNLSINLPPGLLANASMNGGACLRTANVSGTACKVGAGTVTATADPIPGILNLPLPLSVPVTFYLVPPPAPGDLAGLAVEGLGEQIGSTGGIRIRPSGDPSGVGVTLALVLPDQLPVTLLGQTIPTAQISVTEINSTFDGLRYPATCPSAPAAVSATVNSYSDATLRTVAAPLAVTGCSALPFSPVFRATATRDGNDRQVKLVTTITQSANEAPSKSVALAFPAATLAPNLASIRALCLNLAAGNCHTVGSATATSPLYPRALTGQAYLTGSSAGLALTLVFPSPFPLTLTGAVDLIKNSATFTGLPDIPLTNLGVSLNGGSEGLFLSTCQTPTGTANATLTDQNGDKSVRAPSRFTVAGCPPGAGSGTSGAGGSGAAGAGGRNGSTSAGVTAGEANLSRGRFSGLRADRVSLRFRVSAARRGAKLAAVTVELPAGLRFVGHGRRVSGVAVSGARIRSVSISHGHLVITVRRAVSVMEVTVKRTALAETAALRAKARAGRLTSLPLAVVVSDAKARRTMIRVQIKNLGL